VVRREERERERNELSLRVARARARERERERKEVNRHPTKERGEKKKSPKKSKILVPRVV